jgi:hypothetical protein
MTDQPSPVDLASLVATLLQKQTAMLQQQTALLQVHGESMRVQQLLVERLLGAGSAAAITSPIAQPEAPAATAITPVSGSPLPTEVVQKSAPPEPPPAPVPTSDSGSEPAPARAAAPPPPPAAVAVETALEVDSGGSEGRASYAARYYRAAPAGSFVPSQPQDLELLRRLREMGDASGLILQFRPHKGETMGKVAVSDPDYIRQLIFRAQRPEVRAAACRLVKALDAAAEHKRRAARGGGRRSRASA